MIIQSFRGKKLPKILEIRPIREKTISKKKLHLNKQTICSSNGAQVLLFYHYYLNPGKHRNRNLNKPGDFVEKIENFQNLALKNLLGCPKSSSPAVVRLFSGVEPMACRIDLLQLRYFWKILHSDENSIAYTVLKLRKKQFLATKNGFLHEIFNLCCKYDMINIWHGNQFFNISPKLFSKRKVLA